MTLPPQHSYHESAAITKDINSFRVLLPGVLARPATNDGFSGHDSKTSKIRRDMVVLQFVTRLSRTFSSSLRACLDRFSPLGKGSRNSDQAVIPRALPSSEPARQCLAER